MSTDQDHPSQADPDAADLAELEQMLSEHGLAAVRNHLTERQARNDARRDFEAALCRLVASHRDEEVLDEEGLEACAEAIVQAFLNLAEENDNVSALVPQVASRLAEEVRLWSRLSRVLAGTS